MTSSTGADWRQRLREKGYRLTPQRELILQAVEELGTPRPTRCWRRYAGTRPR